MLIYLLSLVIFPIAALYLYFKRRYTYWEKSGLKSLKPTFPLGNLEGLWRGVAPVVQFSVMYNALKSAGLKHGGVYMLSEPMYMAVDPEYVKNILIKDFNHFVNRGIYLNEEDQPLIGNLFLIEGFRWKNLRAKLTPTFTSGKMKMMFGTMLDCASPLSDRIDELSNAGEVIDVKDAMARFTTDVIGSCAFGIDCNSFRDPNSEFRKFGLKIFHETTIKAILNMFKFCFPNASKKLGLLLIDRDVEKFFTDMVNETYQRRKSENIRRNDFMQLLIELKDHESSPGSKLNTLSMNEVVAQAFLFFIAGFDTSSTALTFCLFELARNLRVQQKLRDEINGTLDKNCGALTYELVMEMKYMQQVIDETLRKYPPVSLLFRICTETYKVPDSNVVLQKGTPVVVSVRGLHHDPEFYPDPEKFDPDRFTEENKRNIVPGMYLPFGDGPRVCIGLRFGIMQIKIGLITLLKDFEFTLNAKTQVPLQYDLGFILKAKGGVWLNSRRIS